MKQPDARIDVDGKTFRFLTMHLSNVQQAEIKEALLSSKQVKPIVNTKLINKHVGTNHLSVTYKSSLPQEERIVSSYSMTIIKMALKESGMNHTVITSTIRAPHEQAHLMYIYSQDNINSQYKL